MVSHVIIDIVLYYNPVIAGSYVLDILIEIAD